MTTYSVRRTTMAVGVLAATFAGTLKGMAQHTAAVTTAITAGVTSPAASILARPVTIQLSQVSRKHALASVAESAGVRIQYRVEGSTAFERLVSVHASAMPLSVVLEQILDGTGMHAQPLTDNIITLKAGEHASVRADGTVRGKVVNSETNQPIRGAVVTVGNNGKRVVTGNDGTFQLELSSGEHMLVVRAVGFVRHSQRVVVQEGSAVTAEVRLAASASVLDEVIVTGTVVATERKAIPTPITVITAKDIEQRGITKLEQLFRGEIPGLLALERGAAVYTQELMTILPSAKPTGVEPSMQLSTHGARHH